MCLHYASSNCYTLLTKCYADVEAVFTGGFHCLREVQGNHVTLSHLIIVYVKGKLNLAVLTYLYDPSHHFTIQ